MNKTVSFNHKTESAQHLQALWTELEKQGLDGFLVPHTDEYQSEYIPPSAQRLAWLTGFTGSAGLAIVFRHGSAIFVDGRYTLAVREQVEQRLFEPHNSKDCPPTQWLKKQPAAKLGYDPWLHTPQELELFQRACQKAGSELIPCEINPIDTVWHDQPEPPLAPVMPYPLRYAGKTSHAKCEQLSKKLIEDHIDAVILTAPDSIAWLLNIRGGDVLHTPVPLCFAILHSNSLVDLFINPRKLEPKVLEHLGDQVTIHNLNALRIMLDELGQEKKTVCVDPKGTAIWIFNRLKQAGANVIKGDDPCILPKACKNKVEIAGIRAAHRRDGIALTRFLHWLAQHPETERLDEIQAAERLAQFRADTDLLHDLSFATISAIGANAAIVHYQPTVETNTKFLPNTLYLVDSGGQYLDGTTDVTRTIAIGKPTTEQKKRFTQVLKGHIGIATCRFPKKTSGAQLDVLARHALWQAGLDFEHGTGHGVGCFLSVHEGPQGISKRENKTELKPGMILSNEPGYYKEGAYGIRIENLITVTEPQAIDGGEQEMMGFETLTQAPIDLNLVEPSLLNEPEITWLNNYHQTVFETVGMALDEEARNWLAQATRALV